MKTGAQYLIVGWAWASAVILVGAVGTLIGFLLVKGLPALNLQLIFGSTDPLSAVLLRKQVFDGLLPAITGTLILVVTAVAIALPMGLGAGIYLAEYGRGNLKRLLSLLFDILAGIPSIVVGLFGFSLAIFLHHHFSQRIYPCLLVSALSLSFLVLPYLVRSTQAALEDLPPVVRMVAPALGATKLQNLLFVLLPRSLDGIVSGVVLSIGRCAEDTAVIMLTGAVATAGMPSSLMGSYEALPFYIFYVSSQYMNQQELLKGYGAGIILLFVCGLLFFISFGIKRRIAVRMHHGI